MLSVAKDDLRHEKLHYWECWPEWRILLMPFHRLLLLMAALIFLVTLIQFGMVSVAFEKLGLSQDSAYLLLLTTLVGSMVNVPLFSVEGEREGEEPALPDFYRRLGFPRPKWTGRTVVGVNVGGAITPAAFSLYLFLHNPLAPMQVIAVVALVSAVAYWSSFPVRGVGIAMHFLLAPCAAALVSILVNPALAAPLAYIGGTLGVLIGADLLHLGSLRKLGTPLASIGGAGSFDGVFLSGLIAVLLA